MICYFAFLFDDSIQFDDSTQSVFVHLFIYICIYEYLEVNNIYIYIYMHIHIYIYIYTQCVFQSLVLYSVLAPAALVHFCRPRYFERTHLFSKALCSGYHDGRTNFVPTSKVTVDVSRDNNSSP